MGQILLEALGTMLRLDPGMGERGQGSELLPTLPHPAQDELLCADGLKGADAAQGSQGE